MPALAEQSAVSSMDFPASMIELCDNIANRGAAVGRAGRPFNAFSIVAFEYTDDFTANNLVLMSWVAELGWREGMDERRVSSSRSACGGSPAGEPCRKGSR